MPTRARTCRIPTPKRKTRAIPAKSDCGPPHVSRQASAAPSPPPTGISMFVICMKRNLPRRLRHVGLMGRIALLFAAQLAVVATADSAFAHGELQLMSAPGSLIGDDAGSKRIDFKIAPESVSDGDQVVATLYRYDDNAELSQ